MLNSVQPSTAAVVPLQGAVVSQENLLSRIEHEMGQPNGVARILAALGNEIIQERALREAFSQQVTAMRTQATQITEQRDLQTAQVVALTERVETAATANAALRTEVDAIALQHRALTLQANQLRRELTDQLQRVQLQETLMRLETELAQLNVRTDFNPVSGTGGTLVMGLACSALGPAGTILGALGGGSLAGYLPAMNRRQELQPRIDQLHREIQAARQQLALLG